MYIAHYKAVKSNKEFFSVVRNTLDFPTQVEYESERYLLQTTFSVSSKSLQKNLRDRADELGIPRDINVD
jgi:hypothetical protein